VREVDEEFIYGNYSCRATNQMGVGVHLVEMRRASKLPCCSVEGYTDACLL